MSTRLANIELANTKSRSRDFWFAVFVAFTAVISIASIGTAVKAATQLAQL